MLFWIIECPLTEGFDDAIIKKMKEKETYAIIKKMKVKETEGFDNLKKHVIQI